MSTPQRLGVIRPTLFAQVLLAALIGCSKNNISSIQSTQKSRFSGRIIDSETGKPIPDMCVKLRGTKNCLAKTDSVGQYSFEVTGDDPFLVAFIVEPGDRSRFMSFYHRDSRIISTFYYTHTRPYPIMDSNKTDPSQFYSLPGGGSRPAPQDYKSRKLN
jgi:hypothetical protein